MNTDKWMEALYNANAKRIYRIAAYLLNNSLGHAADAADIVQEVFLLAARSDIRNHPKPEAWLAATAKYVCSNYVRSQMRNARKQEKAGKALAKKNIHCIHSYTEPSIDNTGVSDVMLTLKQTLSAEEYELIEAYCIENRSVEEIARATGMSANHVRVKIYRIREKIKKNFPDV